MERQPRYDPLEASAFFRDGMASRPLVEGTVARGHLRIDDHFYRGRVDGQPARDFPDEVELTRELLLRGRERYDIFCSHCHDRAGTGRGMVAQAGFPGVANFHGPELGERLRGAPHGHIFDVITNGLGRMPPHADQIPPRDRWAIVAWVRVLQLSQHADPGQLTDEDLQRLEEVPANDANRRE